MTISDLYGFRFKDVQAVRSSIESVIGCQMEAHESAYRGGEYYLVKLPDGAKISVQGNFDNEEDDYAEIEYPQMQSLVYVDCRENADEIRSKFLNNASGIEFLQRKILDGNRFQLIKNEGGREVSVIDKRVK